MQTQTIRPLHDQVVIRPDPMESQTAGGIILTNSASEKPRRGRILAVGKGKLSTDGVLHPLDVQIGDIAIYGHHVGSAVKIDGEELMIMKEMDILGILPE